MGRGPLCCVVFLFASSTFAGQQYKWVDMAPPAPPGTVSGLGIGLNQVRSNGALVVSMAGITQYGNAVRGTRTCDSAGHWSELVADVGGICTNSKGDFGYNGTYVYGYYTSHAGGTIHYAATGQNIPVPASPGYDWPEVRGINDAGVIVGHYSAFVNDGSFAGGMPLYIRNGQIYIGQNIGLLGGSFIGVDSNGFALYHYGFWSPETGKIVIPGLSISNDEYVRPDFNDHFTVLQSGLSFTDAFTLYSPSGPVSIANPAFIDIENAYTADPGGLNNLNSVVWNFRHSINGKVQNHWTLYSGGAWTDLYASIASQVPTGWTFGPVKDIDDFGRVYGTMIKPDGSYTVVRLDPVPEPATLATLALGALLLRRKKSARTRAA